MRNRGCRVAVRSTVGVVALLGGGIDVSFCQEPAALQPKDALVCLLVNKASGRCLSVADGSIESGARIVQGPMPSQSGPSEHWRLFGAGPAFRLRNEKSGLVLQVWSSNRQRGVQPVQSADQISKEHQHWSFEPVGDAYLLRAGHSQLVLGVANSSGEEGARVIQWDPLPDKQDQLWVVRSTDDREDIGGVANPAHPAPDEENSTPPGWIVLAAIVGVALVLALAISVWVTTRQRRAAQPRQPLP